MVEGHRDIEGELKDIITNEIEIKHQLYFREDEVIDKALKRGIPEAEARLAFMHLLADEYLHEESGRQGVYCRKPKRGDYSPGGEFLLEY